MKRLLFFTLLITCASLAGHAVIEVDGVSFDIAKEALRLAAQKLPVATKFVVRRDYDPTQLV